MNSFMHQQATRPTRLLLACLLGLGLAACGGEGRDALLGQAKTGIAKGDIKAAIIQFKNAVMADEKMPKRASASRRCWRHPVP